MHSHFGNKTFIRQNVNSQNITSMVSGHSIGWYTVVNIFITPSSYSLVVVKKKTHHVPSSKVRIISGWCFQYSLSHLRPVHVHDEYSHECIAAQLSAKSEEIETKPRERGSMRC